jgi:hypothetical protein
MELLAPLRLLRHEACLEISAQGNNDCRDRLFVGQVADAGQVVECFHIDGPHFQSLVDAPRETMIERKLRFTVLLRG